MMRSQYETLADVEQPPIPQTHSPDSRSRWSHLNNLDQFFRRVYEYHQRHGFLCMFVSDLLDVAGFVFICWLGTFLAACVNYPVLFRNRLPDGAGSSINGTFKLTFGDVLIPNCSNQIPAPVVFCLIVAGLFLCYRVVRNFFLSIQYWEIGEFYQNALKINGDQLMNCTWHQVQQRLCEVQVEQQFCIQKRELNELDIYQRILRYKNYLVAMVNKQLLPCRFRAPIVGDVTFFTSGLRFNLELILFWGPWAPWENYWRLKGEFKRRENAQKLADEMASKIFWLGVANLVLAPVIFLWQILYSFCQYADLVKREPSYLGSRCFSLYGQYCLRHFNELDHEVEQRLNRAYRPASQYMEMFLSPLLVVFARNVMFFAGALLTVMLILTAYDEDVIQVEHVLTVITLLGVVVAICRAFVPDEHMIFCPELAMTYIIAQIHYVPDTWKEHAHTQRVRKEFSQLFQYRFAYLLEELFSPLITPWVLLFWLRPRSKQFVDFMRHFTIEVPGLGDVCSFAQMDLARHGDKRWQPDDLEAAAEAGPSPIMPFDPDFQFIAEPAAQGKTELSLIHFAITNPNWQRPMRANEFLRRFQQRALHDCQMIEEHQAALGDNPMLASVNQFGAGMSIMPGTFVGGGGGGGGIMSLAAIGKPDRSFTFATAGGQTSTSLLRGSGVSHSEGPLAPREETSILASLHQSMSGGRNAGGIRQDPLTSSFGTGANIAEMNLSMMYMHELFRRNVRRPSYGSFAVTPSSAATPQDERNAPPHRRMDLWAVPEANATEEERPPDLFSST